MVVVHRADADLDQPVGQPLFHDPGKRGRVRARVVLVGMVDIRMRIDVHDREAAVAAPHGPHDRVRDGVIAAQADQRIT